MFQTMRTFDVPQIMFIERVRPKLDKAKRDLGGEKLLSAWLLSIPFPTPFHPFSPPF